LLEGLSSGVWKGLLPSLKDLARALGFSPPVVTAALRRLAARRLVASPGPRRRYRILSTEPAVVKAPRGAEGRRLLLLTQTGPDRWDESQRRVVMEILDDAAADGWACARETTDFLAARTSLKTWDRLLTLHRPTHVVAIQGTRVLAEWAARNNLRVAFIGGQQVEPRLAAGIGIRLSDILGHCIGHLMGLGHRRILLPTWGGLRQLPDFCARELGKALGMDPARLLGEGWVFGAPATELADHRARLLRHLRRLRPTAVVTVDWRDYLVASQCLEDEGLRVPGDVSLAVLNHGPEVDWVRPAPAHYRIAQDYFAREVRAWRRGRELAADSATRAVLAAWKPGATVGPAAPR
jgi:DNA-binding LacI/PurR family transcriptional regulator